MVSVTFPQPEYLWVLAAIPFAVMLHFFGLQRAQRKAMAFANFAALERATGTAMGVSNNLALLVSRITILVLLSLALSGATLWYVGTASAVDYSIAMDTSSSMLANDIPPSRIDAAKSAAVQFLGTVPPRTKVALVTFGGASVIRSKGTDDLQKISGLIREENTSEMGGTAIGEAIVTSVNLLMTSTRGRAVIVITDGQNNIGVSLDEAVKYAKDNGAAIYAIGIGTPEGGTFGSDLLKTEIDEASLKAITSETNGAYFRATDDASLRKAFESVIESKEQNLSIDLVPYLIILTLALLFIEWALANLRYSRLDFS